MVRQYLNASKPSLVITVRNAYPPEPVGKGGKPLFVGNGYAGLSDMALYYIGVS